MDAREINRFFCPPPFKLPNVLNVLGNSGDKFYCKLDFSDAYMHVRFTDKFAQWFTFEYGGKRFLWKHMGFGWNMAPHIFQSIADAVCQYITEKFGIHALVYYDDLLLFCRDERKLGEAMPLIVDQLVHLGFQLNEAKCVTSPVKQIQWLGFNLTSNAVGYGPQLVNDIETAARALEERQDYRTLLHYTGILSWASIVSRPLARHLSLINHSINGEIRCDKSKHSTRVPQDFQSPYMKQLLYEEIPAHAKSFILSPHLNETTVDIYVDASTSGGFFGFCNGEGKT